MLKPSAHNPGRLLLLLLLTGIALPGAFCQGNAQQTGATEPPEQQVRIPEWQTAAGGKLEFDVASVKEDKTDQKPFSTFPLNPGPQFVPNGGHLVAANMVLLQYIVFAYKMTSYQIQTLRRQLPDWARVDHFDIQAHAEGNPSKDQMRLMMQSLLEERFKIRVHHEIRQVPVFALVLVKPGKTGPKLRVHPVDDPGCSKTPMPEKVPGSYPPACGASATVQPSLPGLMAIDGRKVTIESFTIGLTNLANNIDKPVVDQTGLTGTFDYTLEWQPESPVSWHPTDAQDDFLGATFSEALREQLGLKLVRTVAPIDVIVLDGVQYPTEN